jgi:hypothetical protein
MAESRFSQLRAVLKPWGVRGIGALGAYDIASNQFDWPTLGQVLGMSGSLLPMWAWFFILLSVLFYGLFEYVRLKIPASGHPPSNVVNWRPWISMESYTAHELALIIAKADPASMRLSSEAIGYLRGLKRAMSEKKLKYRPDDPDYPHLPPSSKARIAKKDALAYAKSKDYDMSHVERAEGLSEFARSRS